MGDLVQMFKSAEPEAVVETTVADLLQDDNLEDRLLDVPHQVEDLLCAQSVEEFNDRLLALKAHVAGLGHA